jgi:hypothetical protein
MDRAAKATLKIARITMGLLLALISMSFLIQGGFSRYAKYGIPRHANPALIAVGLIALTIGLFLLRSSFFLRRHTR